MESENVTTIVADLVLEADQNQVDADSSPGDDIASSTQSVSSSIVDYRRENGRTYHKYKDGKYNLPNDEVENERLDFQHHQFLITFSNLLGMAPPNLRGSRAKRVLDLGTGTGIWATDFADEHPEAEVIGIDLSPIQPGFVPPNVRFIIDDIDEEWTYSEPFDYIHSRMMNFSVPSWKEYLRKMYDNLTPGGFVEVQEVDVLLTSDDNTLTPDHPLHKWCHLLNEASIKANRPCQNFDTIRKIMAEVGFADIVDTRFKWPTNPWPQDQKHKEIGTWNQENWIVALDALSIAPFTKILGWDAEEVKLFLADVRKDLNDRTVHAYSPICSIYGKKPRL